MANPDDDAILKQMSQLAQGRDPYGNPVDRDTRMLALDRYTALKKEIVAAATEESRRVSDEKMQAQRLEAEAAARAKEMDLERERLRIEAEKVEAQKAEILVRALEAVARGGPQALEQLGSYVQSLGARLIGESHQITIKAEGETK